VHLITLSITSFALSNREPLEVFPEGVTNECGSIGSMLTGGPVGGADELFAEHHLDSLHRW
jgi:hypothetical protein